MKKELKIGVFVVAVLVASFFVLNYLRGEDIFDREYEIISRYETVDGLVASAPVFIKGYKAGKVTAVEYDAKEDNFVVICSVSKDFKIPSDSEMVIYAVDLMGGKGIKINLGKSEEFIGDEGVLAAAFENGLMDSLAGNIAPLMEKVSNTLDSLQVTVSGVNTLLSENNQKSFSNILAQVEATMKNLKALSGTINGKSEEIVSLMNNLNEFSSKLIAVSEKVDTTLTGVNSALDKVNASDIEGLVSSFRSLLVNINDPEGSVGKLLNNDSVYNSVDSLLIEINSLVAKIQENPKKYLKISVF
jgi:phospholipid/cholesterol/gamma-HCH transport system substrate-binding protein